MMKQWTFFSLICLILALPAKAQESHKQIDVLKTEFLTEKLDLSSQEAQQFWPVYREYQQKIRALFAERRKVRRDNKERGIEPGTEIRFDERFLEIKKTYNDEFLKVLPKTKVALLYEAEREFREKLIDQLRQRRKKEHRR